MYDNEFETKEIKFKPRIKLNHNMYKRMILFLMPSSLNTVGKITCYDFTKKCLERRVSKVFIKKVHLVKGSKGSPPAGSL